MQEKIQINEKVKMKLVISIVFFFSDSIFSNSDLSSKLFPCLNRLLEDDSVKTRLFVIKAYRKLFDQFKRDFPAHLLPGISTGKLQL